MTHNNFEEFKREVKSKYEVEKSGTYSSFLLPPSRANLRKLCTERLNGNTSADDLSTFKLIFGFDFENNHNKLKNETGRFRAIENFFKGETDTNDIETINLAAILVDFNPRPFRRYNKSNESTVESPVEEKHEKVIEADYSEYEATVQEKTKNLKKWILLGIGGLLLGFTVIYTAKDLIFPQKQCMQWQKDHYEPIDCQNDTNGFFSSAPVVPYDEDYIDLQKLEVCDSTTFFIGEKPLVWYCKVNGKIEYFDGPGYHPITNKALKPITGYIINKYIRGK